MIFINPQSLQSTLFSQLFSEVGPEQAVKRLSNVYQFFFVIFLFSIIGGLCNDICSVFVERSQRYTIKQEKGKERIK
jgi:hypothetical protein